MAEQQPPSNKLAGASMVLGIISAIFVFMVGLCAGLGKEQGWLPVVGGLLFIVGATCAFMGLLSVVLGIGGLFSRGRAPGIVGAILGLFALFLFAAILNAVK